MHIVWCIPDTIPQCDRVVGLYQCKTLMLFPFNGIFKYKDLGPQSMCAQGAIVFQSFLRPGQRKSPTGRLCEEYLYAFKCTNYVVQLTQHNSNHRLIQQVHVVILMCSSAKSHIAVNNNPMQSISKLAALKINTAVENLSS